jgi:hypothetical protein
MQDLYEDILRAKTVVKAIQAPEIKRVMIKSGQNKQEDIPEVADRREPVTTMAPLMIGEDSSLRHASTRSPSLKGLCCRIGCRHAFCCGPKRRTRRNKLPPKAGSLIEAVLYRGELPRGDIAEILGVTTRHARRIVSALVERGVFMSKGPRDPLLLAFPAALASRWMPGLFPERTSDE